MSHESLDEREKKGNDAAARDQASSQTGSGGTQPAGEREADAALDVLALDLSIETVEERISPGETNVFDK